jgi:hypothetical protein
MLIGKFRFTIASDSRLSSASWNVYDWLSAAVEWGEACTALFHILNSINYDIIIKRQVM